MATVRVLTAKFLFFFIYKESMAEILRLQCETYANFSVVHQNTRLHNHRFEPPLDTDTEMCQVECGMDPKCKSINVNEDEFICEINDISAADPKDQTNAVQETGWTFYSPSYTDRLVGINCQRQNPCANTHKCIDICECPGYKCIEKFKLFNEAKKWRDARKTCEEYGGDLASIHDDEEYNIVVELLKASGVGIFYIGLTDAAQEGEFVWSDGTDLKFKKWENNEPNNHRRKEDCGVQTQYGWNDVYCDSSRPFICKFIV